MKRRPRLAVSKEEVQGEPGRLIEGDITEFEAGVAIVRAGRRLVSARVPRNVAAADWLAAAVAIAPVEAVVMVPASGRPFVGYIFPTAAQEAALADIDLTGKTIRIAATEGVEVRCGKASLTMDGAASEVRLKGREILSRATSTNRVKGGQVRIG